jgi:TusA-related sulfurtransferase
MIKADKTLDIQGVVYSRSRIVIETTMSSLASGQTLNVITSDRITRQNIAELCKDCGYTLVNISNEHGLQAYTLRK